MIRLTVASLNTRGIPVVGSQLSQRYAAIGAVFEASDADVVNFQEIASYYHLRRLVRSMPSYRAVSFHRGLAGPAGGLVTLSRVAVSGIAYRSFPRLPRAIAARLPRLSRVEAAFKGSLVTRLPGISIVNTHLTANPDGDWSETSRFYGLHQYELAALGRHIGSVEKPAVVSGDFNVARDSSLYCDIIGTTGLIDAFGDDCPPTFRAEYLGPGKSPHCIDYLLTDPSTTVETAELIFTDPLPLAGGPTYASDHLGLQARVTAAR